MLKIVRRLVEQHIPESSAEDHAEHDEEQEVFEERKGDAARQSPLDAVAAEKLRRGKPDEVHQPIPADGQRTEGESNRVEVRMNEHYLGGATRGYSPSLGSGSKFG